MKRYVDFNATLTAEFLQKKKLKKRLDRYWGTINLGGVQVYNSLFPLYPAIYFVPDKIKPMLKIFGISEKEVLESGKGQIESTYLQFSPFKAANLRMKKKIVVGTETVKVPVVNLVSSIDKQDLIDMIQLEVPLNVDREFELRYNDKANPNKFIDLTDPNSPVHWTKQQIFDYVDANYTVDMLDSPQLNTLGILDDIETFIGSYLLLDNGADFELTLLDANVTAVEVDVQKMPDDPLVPAGEKNYLNFTKELRSGINLRISYRRKNTLTATSPIVEMLYNELQTVGQMPKRTSKLLNYLTSKQNVAAFDPDIWHMNHLRVDAFDKLSAMDFMKLVFGSLDTGQTYQKPKSSVLLEIVGVVIGVAVFVFSGGNYALTAVAMNVYGMIVDRMGYPGSAVKIGRWSEVVGAVALVNGVGNAINAFKEAVVREAATEAAKEVAAEGTSGIASTVIGEVTTVAADGAVQTVEVTIQNVADATMKMTSNSMGVGGSILDKMSAASKVIDPLVKHEESNKMKELASMQDQVKAQQVELAQMYDKTEHMGIAYISQYTRPVTALNMFYNVDKNYDPGGFNVLKPSFAKTGLNIIT